MEYDVIECKERELMVTFINAALRSGWKPLGGISVYAVSHVRYYTQALYREAK